MTTVLESLNDGLRQALTSDKRVYLLGQDILDPYGGAFKITRGLSQAFPERVLTTPISEAGIVGVGAGMAMRGLRPVVEIMFGDFLTIAADQLVNHVAKFPWMYSGGKEEDQRVTVPLVVRTPMGGRRGYGPTHSQTLEKHFLGVPGLRVLAPNAFGDPGAMLLQAINSEDPVLFIEHKLLYLLAIQDKKIREEFELEEFKNSAFHKVNYAPTFKLRLRGSPPPYITLAAYGYMAELAQQALLRLAYEHEIFCELVVPSQLAPFDTQQIISSLSQTRRLLTVEEGSFSLGWGAEILARAAEALGPRLRVCRRLAASDLPIPASQPLESAVLPGVEQIIEVCRAITSGA